MISKPVLRIKLLRICRFRGFVNSTPITLDTDADVVLVTGPNGFGKTSLIDALCLLLNGHYYAERLPLVSCGAADGNCPGTARVEAEVEYAACESGTKMVVICNNPRGSPDISVEGGSCPNGISPELAARCSFYYQDLLSKLFEEEDAQAPRLLEFLRPLPRAVSTVRDALKKARGRWKDEVSALAQEGDMPSESTIAEERKQAGVAFRDAWHELVNGTQAELGISLPGEAGERLFLSKSDYLRSGWESELRNLAADCLALLLPGRPQPAPDEKPSVSLRLMEESLLALRRIAISQTGGVREKLRSLLDDLPDDTELLLPYAWPGEEKDIAVVSEKVGELEAQASLLERLERHFDNPGGPDLLTILTTLREKGKDWLDVPDAGPDLSPPSSVVGWLREVVSRGLAGLADHLEAWQSRIAAKRLELVQHLFDLRKAIQERRALLEKSRQIYALLRDPRLRHPFGALIDAGSPVFSSALKAMLGRADLPNNLLATIERAQEVVSQWRQIEERDEQRKVVLQRKAGYLRAKELIDSVANALEQETGKNSVLNTAILPPDDVIRDLQRIVNQVLDRFRLVDGISPVRFEARRDRSGKAGPPLQVYAADGRPLGAFSTGQKAQLGLAMLLGLNYSLHKYIGHNVLALDDVTTAFDMAQLPRTAALIRQIAYATGEAPARRQVFIVSHHEDLTNRLLDFLIPPQGRKLRILNFVNWSSNNGPEIEQREVIPSLKSCVESRKKFMDILNCMCQSSY